MLVAVNSNAQWVPNVRLTDAPLDSQTSMNNARCIASSGNIVHVVWYDERTGIYGIYYKRSTDGGVSWGTDTRLSYSTAHSYDPSIAISGSIIHVVWRDYRDMNFEIYYKRSTDAGISWGADTRLTNNTAISMYPSIAVSGSILHVVWQDDRDGVNNTEIYYKRSSDSGMNWGADKRLTNNTGNSNNPSVAVSDSVVHIVWYDHRDGGNEIYYKRSIDGGVSWGIDTRLTFNNSGSETSIAVSDSEVHVVWEDGRNGHNDTYHKRSTDAGVSWGTDTRLRNIPGFTYSYAPSVAVSGSDIHVVWVDFRYEQAEIYYKHSSNYGANWGEDIWVTNDPAASWCPSITTSDSVVHVVWSDNRDGNYEIYYRREPIGNSTGIQNIGTETPSKYSLSQNYPNPFNPTTKIRFSIVNGFPIGAFGNVYGKKCQEKTLYP